MDILTGLLYINDEDVFARFGAFLSEESPGENKNYAALLKLPATKSQVSVSIREQNGEKLPAALVMKYEPRDITLQFAIIAPDRVAFLERYRGFGLFLKNGIGGWLNIRLPELGRTYRVHYKEMSDYDQLTDLSGEVAARFNVKFREPVPAV